ncbi:MAG: DMT family transporter [Anaerolineae bacterium]|nr:DMT family transporter [Anaerolineae bacterium]
MRKWAAFWLVALIWGSSFLLIRIGVEELSPFQVVFIRTGIAAVGINLVLVLLKKRLPLDFKRLFPLIVIGIGNTTIPFALITWGEQSIDSGLAAVLQSSAAFFTMLIAHFVFFDEKLSLKKVAGLILGFLGVVTLASRSWASGTLVVNELTGALAIVLASLFYAVFTIYSRKQINTRYEPIVVSAGAMTFAAISSGILMVLAPYFNGEPATMLVDVSSDVLIAIGLLGLVNTFVAYLMYYWVVQQLGAGRASMVTYVVPAVGLILGVLILNEPLDWQIIVGAALIFCGIAVVNVSIKALRRMANRSAAVDALAVETGRN